MATGALVLVISAKKVSTVEPSLASAVEASQTVRPNDSIVVVGEPDWRTKATEAFLTSIAGSRR